MRRKPPWRDFSSLLKEVQSEETSAENCEGDFERDSSNGHCTHIVQNKKISEENCEGNITGNSSSEHYIALQMETETPDVMSANNITEEEPSETEDNIAELREAAEAFVTVSTKYGNADTLPSLKKFIGRIRSIKSTNQLNSFLNSMGSYVKKGAGRGKIPCQPTSIARRSPGMPRGAATIGKGRRPSKTLTSRSKRPHNLAHNVKSNVANAKSHGTGH